jgi:hypothetical protein
VEVTFEKKKMYDGEERDQPPDQVNKLEKLEMVKLKFESALKYQKNNKVFRYLEIS